jgi:hypothetical protein
MQKEQESSDKIVSWYGFEPIWSMAVLCLGANLGRTAGQNARRLAAWSLLQIVCGVTRTLVAV